MKNILVVFFTILTVSVYSQSINLSIKVTNIKEIKGNMSIAVFNRADGFPSGENYFVGKHVPIESKDFIYVFKNIPAGKYAIAVYQDINKNGKLDTNWFGIPTEPYGFSYIEKGETGSADFDEALVNLTKSTILNINLIH